MKFQVHSSSFQGLCIYGLSSYALDKDFGQVHRLTYKTDVLDFLMAITSLCSQPQKVNPASAIYTHYYNSNVIWHTVSRQVDEVIPLDHSRREAPRVIQWYDLIHET